MRWWETREFGVALMFLALGSIAQYIVPQYGIPIAVGVAIVGYSVIRNADKKECIHPEAKTDTTTLLSNAIGQRHLIPKKWFRGNDWLELEKLDARVQSLHRHTDADGIRSDRLDGYTWSEISAMPCHECQIPRNKERD